MTRLDLELVARGLARSRSQAQALISAGRVTVDGQVVRRAAVAVPPAAVVEARTDPYVSRGAHKLAGALDDLDLAVPARALDAGSSTGGFTQVLLERGCAEVVAVDVGTGQLVEPLRSDPRVRLLEQTNLRDLTLAHVDERPVDLVVADVSFISLTLLLRPLTAVTAPDGRPAAAGQAAVRGRPGATGPGRRGPGRRPAPSRGGRRGRRRGGSRLAGAGDGTEPGGRRVGQPGVFPAARR